MKRNVSREDAKKLTAPIKEKVKITVTRAGTQGPRTYTPLIGGAPYDTGFTPGRKATKDNRFVNNKDYGRIGGGLR